MRPHRHALPLLLGPLIALCGCNCGSGLLDPRKSNSRSVLCIPPVAGEAVVLAAGLDAPRKLATDGTALYFTAGGAFGTGAILRTSLTEADAGALAIATGFDSPDAIAVDTAYVYFTDELGVWRVLKSGEAPAELLVDLANNALAGETAIALLGNRLIVSTGLEWLARLGKDGSDLTLLHTAPPGSAVKSAAVEGDLIYFLVASSSDTSGAGLFRVSASSDQPAERLFPEPTLGRALSVTQDAWFYSEGTSLEFGGAVKSRKRTDGGVVIHGERQWGPGAIAVALPYVYFAARTPPPPDNPPSDHFLLRGSGRCDDGGVIPVGPEGFGTGGLLLHDDTLYFTSAGVAGDGYVGRIP